MSTVPPPARRPSTSCSASRGGDRAAAAKIDRAQIRVRTNDRVRIRGKLDRERRREARVAIRSSHRCSADQLLRRSDRKAHAVAGCDAAKQICELSEPRGTRRRVAHHRLEPRRERADTAGRQLVERQRRDSDAVAQTE
jgi:hypothetical protein